MRIGKIVNQTNRKADDAAAASAETEEPRLEMEREERKRRVLRLIESIRMLMLLLHHGKGKRSRRHHHREYSNFWPANPSAPSMAQFSPASQWLRYCTLPSLPSILNFFCRKEEGACYHFARSFSSFIQPLDSCMCSCPSGHSHFFTGRAASDRTRWRGWQIRTSAMKWSVRGCNRLCKDWLRMDHSHGIANFSAGIGTAV